MRNYYCYCGIEKEEYNAIKKEAYISNFVVWHVLHFLLAFVFAGLFIASLFNSLMKVNMWIYLAACIYSSFAYGFFYILKKDSIAAQLLIYLTISLLFLFACFIARNNPHGQATAFIVFLLVTPMFMIDKPYFMSIELVAASIVYLLWMRGIKDIEIWSSDLVNVITYTIVGIFLNIIANSLRIREFVLTRKINIQKDTDGMTGLMNKDALTRNINDYLVDETNNKGLLFVIDVDKFKSINDSYGHDIGDSVIKQLGDFLREKFVANEIVGRFGGDEFIVFIKSDDDRVAACEIADALVKGVSDRVSLPDKDKKVVISIGIAIYKGREKNYSELFKKADIALYDAKEDAEKRFYIYEQG